MPDLVRTERHDHVLVVEIDNPPVNALTAAVFEALIGALDSAERDPGVAAIVVKGAGRTFPAGADIAMLEDAAWGGAAAAGWHQQLQRVEDCRVPVVMAIHGSALGGGLELAMAGHYRISVPDAQIGLPEVSLGIIPGGEGTQRLPRLAGMARALDMCVTGRPLSAPDAVAAGILDGLADDDLTASAIAFARRVSETAPHVRTRDRGERLGDAIINAPLLDSARALAAKVKRHQTAPLRVIEAVAAAADLPFEAGCRREREIFLDCVQGEQAKALIHVFFAERAASKLPEAARGLRRLPDPSCRHRRRRDDGAGDLHGVCQRRSRRGADRCVGRRTRRGGRHDLEDL